MITVMGATGNTGQQITRLLRDAGEEVRVLGRSAERLAAIEGDGIEFFAGDPTDAAYLTQAFNGSDAVYTLLPYNPLAPGYLASQAQQGEAIVEALHASNVSHVVAVSSLGAQLPSGTGLVGSLHEQEARLETLRDVNVLILRAAAFFENFGPALGVIEAEGVYADTVAPNVPIPMISSRDVGTAAAAALITRDWSGVTVHELLGERDVTYSEATSIIGRRIGKPDLEYVQLPDAEMEAILVQYGYPQDYAALQVELNRAISDGRVASRSGRSAENTTATPFEDFVDELVASQGALT